PGARSGAAARARPPSRSRGPGGPSAGRGAPIPGTSPRSAASGPPPAQPRPRRRPARRRVRRRAQRSSPPSPVASAFGSSRVPPILCPAARDRVEPVPQERRELPAAGPELVERLAVVQPAVLHDVADRYGVADVVERVAVEDDEVRELAGLDRADVA